MPVREWDDQSGCLAGVRLFAFALLATCAAIVTAVAAPPSAPPPTSQPTAAEVEREPGERVENREILRRLEKKELEAERTSVRRLLAAPAPLIVVGPSRWNPIVADRDAARGRALRDRAALRAYDGAPPVMPHSRNFAKTKACLDCHTEGIQLGDRRGTPMSHPVLANCMQCHVESRNIDLEFLAGLDVSNDFAGTDAAFGGTRAGFGAPPVVPHPTLMRTNCLSCHGRNGYAGLQTEHPERANCVQCHAVATSLDQSSPFFTGTGTLLLPPANPGEPDELDDETPDEP